MTDAIERPRRHLGLVDATAVYAGIILGSGIFVAPAAVAGAARGPLEAFALWICGGIVAACGASCYAECAGRVPSNGGFFVWSAEVYGPAVAFVSGWAAVLVTYPASIAAISLVFASYLGETMGVVGWEKSAASLALAAAAALSVAGLRTGPRAQIVLTSTKLAALCVLALAVLAARSGIHPEPPRLPAAPLSPASTAPWLSALMILLWTYDGWSDVTLVAGEVRDPGRNLGRAVLLGTATLALVYGATQLAVLAVLPGTAASASPRPVAAAVEAVWGQAAGRGVAALVVVSTFGSILGTVFTVSRLGFAMAREGAFPRVVAPLHKTWGTPVRSTMAVTAAACVYVAFGSFRNILAFFTFSVWIFYGLTAIAVLVLRRRKVGEPVAWRAPLGWLPPAVVLCAGAGMTVRLVIDGPLRALAGATILAAAFPVYALIARSGGRRR